MWVIDWWGDFAVGIEVEKKKEVNGDVIFYQTSENGFTGIQKYEEFERNKKTADRLVDSDCDNRCLLNLESVTSRDSDPIEVEYANIKYGTRDLVLVKYLNYHSQNIFIYHPLVHEGDVVAFDEIGIRLTLSPKEFLLLPKREFQSRQIGHFSRRGAEPLSSNLENEIKSHREYFELYKSLSGFYRNYFISGSAGSGKSTFLKYLELKSDKTIVKLAPTGVAALNIGGQTIHSFFKLPPRYLSSQAIENMGRDRKCAEIDILVIDEISMVRADVFDAIDILLRKNKNSSKPFGGIPVIVMGDIFQLPPIVGNDPNLNKVFKDRYNSPWFFDSNAYANGNFQELSLKIPRRQSDPIYLSLLENVRSGNDIENTIQSFNQELRTRGVKQSKVVTLATTNKIVNNINSEKLAEKLTSSFIYKGRIEGTFPFNSLPVLETLELKVGAQVMFQKNHPSHIWVNGSLGEITYLSNNTIQAQVNGQEVNIELETWENIKYEYDKNSKKLIPFVVGTYTQFPIKLAWAITINKSQGKTYENIHIDLGIRAFCAGQTYVALSRCNSLSGISLERKIRASDIIIDPAVKRFAKDNDLI